MVLVGVLVADADEIVDKAPVEAVRVGGTSEGVFSTMLVLNADVGRGEFRSNTHTRSYSDHQAELVWSTSAYIFSSVRL